jgi:hypothetical protein
MQPRSPLLRVAAALGLMGLAAITPLQAQELPRSFTSLRYVETGDTATPFPPPIELADSTGERTYWLEGALIGGTIVGVLLAAFAGAACSDTDSGAGTGPCWDNVLLGAVVGFGTGGSAGALIGGQFKKPAKEH